MYRCTSPHSCYLGNEKISFPLTVDYCEFEARYSEDNESLAFEFEDLFTKNKQETIKQKDIYYIFHKKDRHFHISQRYIKGKMIQTVRFEFLSAIINGKPIVFEEILEVSAFVEEDALFTKYNKILQQHNCTWPSPWDNKDYPSYKIELMIQNAKVLLERRNQPKPKNLMYHHDLRPNPNYVYQPNIETNKDWLNLQLQITKNWTESQEAQDKICLMIKRLNRCFWVDTKDEVIKIINSLLHSNLTENEIIIKECRFSPTLGKHTHSVVVPKIGLIGFVNKSI